jgi:anti-sigma factor RsiW
MASAEEVQQQLHALIEGSLSREEADALTVRITSDPQVARAYADAMLASGRPPRSEASYDDAALPCDDEAEAGDRSNMFRRLCRMFSRES